MGEQPGSPRYPDTGLGLPPHLKARLHAACTVLKMQPAELIERAIDRDLANLPADKLELIDRIAASLVVSTDFDIGKRDP